MKKERALFKNDVIILWNYTRPFFLFFLFLFFFLSAFSLFSLSISLFFSPFLSFSSHTKLRVSLFYLPCKNQIVRNISWEYRSFFRPFVQKKMKKKVFFAAFFIENVFSSFSAEVTD